MYERRQCEPEGSPVNQDHRFGLLRLLETPGVGVARVEQMLRRAGRDALELLRTLEDSAELRHTLSDRQVEAFQNQEERVRDLWAKLSAAGVRFVSVLDASYPQRLLALLGAKAPPLLMFRGNEALLEKPGVGFCGSRRASEKGLATAADCSEQLAGAGVNVVSGYASGVDMAAHRSALAAGGTTTLVLCEGILHFRLKRELRDLWDWERVLVVSEFLPGLPWSVRHAMQRNSTICALSRAMILIESGSTGGSIEAGKTCLKLGVPLFAPIYEGMPDSAVGNRELLAKGAHGLYKKRGTGLANLEGVLEVVKETPSDPTGRPRQYAEDEGSAAQLMLFDRHPGRPKEEVS